MDKDPIEDRLKDKKVLEELAELDALPEVEVDDKVPDDLPEKPKVPIKRFGRDAWMARLKSWKFWAIVVGVLLVILTTVWFVPVTRQWALNTAGVKTQLRLNVAEQPAQDGQTPTQVKNFQVLVNGQTHSSGDNSTLQIDNLPFGKQTIELQKAGYESLQKEINFDFDPFFGLISQVPKPEQASEISLQLKAVGIPISFMAKDWLSGTPLEGGQYVLGDKTATADKDGKVSLVVPPTDAKTVSVQTKFGGNYIDQTLELTLPQPETLQSFNFVPAGKHYFVSKRTGLLGVYASNIDGSEVAEIVPGSKNESNSLIFAVNPNGKYAVMASTREGTRDSKGALLQKLYVVDLATRKLTTIEQANYFTFYDWSDSYLVYTASTLIENGYESRLKSINVDNRTATQLAVGNNALGGIGMVQVSGVDVLFDQSGVCTGTCTPSKINTINVRGQNAKELAKGSTGPIMQLDYERFAYQVDSKWYEINFNTSQTKSINMPTPDSGKVFLSTVSPNKKTRMLIDEIDGKSTLITKTGDQEKKIHASPGLRGPIRWLSEDVIVFRVITTTETADYAISLRGGEAKKITDVTATSTTGYSGFHYY